MVYELRHLDTALLRFTAAESKDALETEILWINEAARSFFPLDLTVSSEGLSLWLKNRALPESRTYAPNLLSKCGLAVNQPFSILIASKGFSLNDCYWIVEEGFKGSFDNLNLYDNRFSHILASIAFAGFGHSIRTSLPSCPEFTTGGVLPKCWQRSEDSITLFKGDGSKAHTAGREPYCEYYASQIAEQMGLNAVHYDLVLWNECPTAKCALFTSKDISYTPIGRIIRNCSLEKCFEYYNELGPLFTEQLRSMLVFDALICNEERTFETFGVLRDNRTGEISAPSPIFNNDGALFCCAAEEDFENLSACAERRKTPYGLSFEEVCTMAMGETQKEQLRRMEGFRFTRHEILNLPENQLTAIEQFLQERVKTLLALA